MHVALSVRLVETGLCIRSYFSLDKKVYSTLAWCINRYLGKNAGDDPAKE